MLSILDIFRIGIGPSSSHTVGPMRIAARFLAEASGAGVLSTAVGIQVDLHGSLALTGSGHAVDKAIVLGLLGYEPETIDPDEAEAAYGKCKAGTTLQLAAGPLVPFQIDKSIRLCTDIVPTLHPNEMVLRLTGASKEVVWEQTYYSVGGGFIASALQLAKPTENDRINVPQIEPLPFFSAAELLGVCHREKLTLAEVVLRNEDAVRPRAETLAGLDRVWEVMSSCISRGLVYGGVLPGGLGVSRRAPGLLKKLREAPGSQERE